VHKTERDNRTISTISRLNEHEHVQEVAGLMSGAHITEATLQSAKELILNNQHHY
jgi:DNA repair protein RecN (Recombination protein N)